MNPMNQVGAMPKYAAANMIGAPMDAGRQLEVPGGIERLEMRIGSLSDAINELDGRLTGYIARQEGPVNSTAAVPKAVQSTGLGGQLETLGDTVSALAVRLRSLLERLEA